MKEAPQVALKLVIDKPGKRPAIAAPARGGGWVVNVNQPVPFDVYIGRHHPRFRSRGWGNPFRIGTAACRSRGEAIEMYRVWIGAKPELIERAKRELRGKILGCWCAPLPCHGDVLAEIANG